MCDMLFTLYLLTYTPFVVFRRPRPTALYYATFKMLVNIYCNTIDNMSNMGWSNTAFWVPIIYKTVTIL